MNGVSFWSSCGATRNFWTIAGTTAPATIEASARSPIPMMGRAHPRTRMFTKNSSAQATAMNTSRYSADFWTCTSVYEAPVTTPREDTSRSNRPR